MKVYFLITALLTTAINLAIAQTTIPTYDHTLELEPTPDTSANISFGDFDGDGHLDILLVKGRHWPILDRILLGDGKGGIRKAYNLGKVADRSYTGAVADFNRDGFPDVAVSNDAPDKKLVYLNDGKGNFSIASEFGLPGWPTRNMSIADINNDGWPDLILANRGDASSTSNYVCFNDGKGRFSADCIPFARYPATTITPADFNKDGFVDLVVPYRDSGQSYVYLGSEAFGFSDSRRIPFGPPNATIRVAAVADFNGDGLLDIVTADEFHGVSLYYGQRGQSFSAGVLLADAKVVPYALAVADLNKDGKPDILVGHIEAPSIAFINNGSGRNFTPVAFGDSKGTAYGFAIGDFNEDGVPDIGAARSDATNVLFFGEIRISPTHSPR